MMGIVGHVLGLGDWTAAVVGLPLGRGREEIHLDTASVAPAALLSGCSADCLEWDLYLRFCFAVTARAVLGGFIKKWRIVRRVMKMGYFGSDRNKSNGAGP